MTDHTFGDASPAPQILLKSLRLQFTEHFPLKWDDCSTSANFLSQYYTGVLAGNRTPSAMREISHSIAYLVNELVENVVKFRDAGAVEIVAGICDGQFILRITNLITAETSARFQTVLAELTAGDPGDLLIQRIETNAAVGNDTGSGLGILTLMNDYGVRLTWRFIAGRSPAEPVQLETIARLHLEESTLTTSHHGN